MITLPLHNTVHCLYLNIYRVAKINISGSMIHETTHKIMLILCSGFENNSLSNNIFDISIN